MDTETKVNHDHSDKAIVPHATGALQALAYDRNKAKLLADLKMVMADAECLVKEAASSSIETFATLRTRGEAKLSEMKTKIDLARAALGEKAKCATNSTQAYVKENPWKSAGVFAVAGVVL